MSERTKDRKRERDGARTSSTWVWLALTGVVALGMVWVAAAEDWGEIFGIGTGARPAVAADEDGDTVVVWESFDGDETGIWARAVDSFGLPQGGDFLVNTATAGAQIEPDVAYLGSGSFAVVWESDQGSASEVTATLADHIGNPLGTEFRVNSSAPATDPAIAADVAGNFVVTWAGFKNNGHEKCGQGQKVLFARRYDHIGNPLGTEVQFGQRRTDAAPAIAVRPSGDFLVAWQSPSSGISAQAFDHIGNPLGTEFRVNVSNYGEQSSPAVAVALDEDYTVVWERRMKRGKRSILARRVSQFGMPFGEEYQVNLAPSEDLSVPAVAADDRGHTAVSWRSVVDGQTVLVARMIDLHGRPFGDELQIDGSTSLLGVSKITAGGAADFLVVWESWSSTPAPEDATIFGHCLMVPADGQ